ncbi:MAG: tRNA threonylcarbamoyladenosine dehydratase [Oscillospiraceae bacterium]|nr:tRNA threonylcarbamoyladenosine dehydratase [Oscillospiraceae bacterium]
MLLGEEAVKKLHNSRVLLFGLGGVGSAAFEALCRAGVGRLVIVDGDAVDITNINRQLIALTSTVGQRKTLAARNRGLDINPEADIVCRDEFVTAESLDGFELSGFDYVIDAIDTVSVKLSLAERCQRLGVPLISAMGTGGKMHPELLRIGDIYETNSCPLARVMRKELRHRKVEALKVVWSPEERAVADAPGFSKRGENPSPGTVSFVPPVAGYLMAGEVIRQIVG